MSNKELERMDRIILYLETHNTITKSETAQILQIENKTAQRLLVKAEMLGILNGEGDYKGRKYRLNK